MTEMVPVRLGVGVIGWGKVGPVLAAGVARAGHAIIARSPASEHNAQRAELLLPGVPVEPVPTIVERSELVLLCVNDDALPELIESLSAARAWHPGQIVVHTSGRYGAHVLNSAIEQGVWGIAMHPAMTFTGTQEDLGRLGECVFGITGSEEALAIAQLLALELGAQTVQIQEEDRPVYHAALTHGANHLMTLVAQARAVLQAIGIQESAQVLAPLLRASLENALAHGESALSGPVSRGDARTLQTHLSALDRLAEQGSARDVPDAYRALARASAKRQRNRGLLAPECAEAVLRALEVRESENTPEER